MFEKFGQFKFVEVYQAQNKKDNFVHLKKPELRELKRCAIVFQLNLL